MIETTSSLRDLVRRWQVGWGLCRGLRPATELRQGLDVVLDLPGRYREFIALDADSLDWLIQETLDASRPTWLTVLTRRSDEVADVLLRSGLQVFAERKTLMTTDLPTRPSAAPPAGYTTKTSVDGALVTVTIYSGEVAARGLMAVVDGDAVMHDIHTDPAHRRRGLASVVMATLCAQAVERGATTGLLNATSDGALLYAYLGWLPQATLLTARTPESAG
jgi:ribosomal protein S18 acetylase RimI-like enzyme